MRKMQFQDCFLIISPDFIFVVQEFVISSHSSEVTFFQGEVPKPRGPPYTRDRLSSTRNPKVNVMYVYMYR